MGTFGTANALTCCTAKHRKNNLSTASRSPFRGGKEVLIYRKAGLVMGCYKNFKSVIYCTAQNMAGETEDSLREQLKFCQKYCAACRISGGIAEAGIGRFNAHDCVSSVMIRCINA